MLRQRCRTSRTDAVAMIRNQLAAMGNAFTVRIAGATLPVSGSSQAGWGVTYGDDPPTSYRYGTLDELAFALINLSIVDDGTA